MSYNHFLCDSLFKTFYSEYSTSSPRVFDSLHSSIVIRQIVTSLICMMSRRERFSSLVECVLIGHRGRKWRLHLSFQYWLHRAIKSNFTAITVNVWHATLLVSNSLGDTFIIYGSSLVTKTSVAFLLKTIGGFVIRK